MNCLRFKKICVVKRYVMNYIQNKLNKKIDTITVSEKINESYDLSIKFWIQCLEKQAQLKKLTNT